MSEKENSIKNKESEFHMEKYKKKSEYPNFLLKLYQILENKEYKDIIEWSEDGKYFTVKNLHDFTENILPKYYKHNNYSSFIRQLNMYDFHKRKGNPNEQIFEHKNFIKDRKDLLKLIKRKSKKETYDINNINIINNINNNNGIIYPKYNQYQNFFPQKKELLPYISSNNTNAFQNKNNSINSLSIDDNMDTNSYIKYNKKIPLLPMGSINNNNSNIIIEPNNNNINISSPVENNDKKITKKNLQNLLTYLMHSVDENTETQKQLEQKIENLSNQNEKFISQNKKILQEIIAKNDYNKKLEAVICFILEMIIPKTKVKTNNNETKNLFLSNEPMRTNTILNNNDILENYQNFLKKYYERNKNNNQEIYFPINNYDANNTEILKSNLIVTDDNFKNNNYPLVLSNKRKRSESFNSIISNFSQRSNNIYFNNNNKLLKSEEDNEKKNEDKNDDIKIKRKDSLSSWNENNKSVFDLDINQDENKSFISSGFNNNKDLLNNSQTSFNEYYINPNPNNTFSDINN